MNRSSTPTEPPPNGAKETPRSGGEAEELKRWKDALLGYDADVIGRVAHDTYWEHHPDVEWPAQREDERKFWRGIAIEVARELARAALSSKEQGPVSEPKASAGNEIEGGSSGDESKWTGTPSPPSSTAELTGKEDSMTFAWLIEAPGQNYLGAREIAHGPEFYWTRDHNAALRLCSNEQAAGVLAAVRALNPDLFGFARTLGDAWPVEHGWLPTADIRNVRGNMVLARDRLEAAAALPPERLT